MDRITRIIAREGLARPILPILRILCILFVSVS